MTQEAWGASQTATIASFNYTPKDVQIAVGDTVVWRNLDATVHTVTASRGEFNSGSMRQGQEWSATFTVPGVYPYFCEPHEFMRGSVSVTGPAPTTTIGSPTTTTAAAAPVTSTTFRALEPLPNDESAADHNGSAAGDSPVVVASGVTGAAEQPSPVLPILGLVVVTGAAAGALRRAKFHYLAAALTVATGLLHLQVRVALDYPEPVGTLLVIEAAGAGVLAAWLMVHPWTRHKQLVAIGAHVAALGALAVTRTSLGLFGFHEIGWDPSPQLPLAVTIGLLAIAALAAARRNFE
jgi:Copper binding proteins, plastocyanin/azurin family